MAFRRMPKHGEEARHLDDIRSHNVLSNLKWGSRLDNARDAVRNGGSKRQGRKISALWKKGHYRNHAALVSKRMKIIWEERHAGLR
jgi:hypothetical protein